MIKKIITSTGMVIALVASLLTFSPTQSFAATINFQPGNIISDGQFYDGNSMTAQDIQIFLNQQVPRCTLGDPGRVPGTIVYGSPLAKDCLKTAKFNTVNRAADAYCKPYIGKNGESAAEIISKIGIACGINPRVLLVNLQKEQSLITDDWPTTRQIDVAMGYACPDSGPNFSPNCDASYYGFFNQVYNAGRQLKRYKSDPGFNWFPVKATTKIQYTVNPACGTRNVFIENNATAALYYYTPYTPHDDLLNGKTYTCAAGGNGNLNFFNLFIGWFGQTTISIHEKFQSYATGNTAQIGVAVSNATSAKGAIEQVFENATLTWHANTGLVITKGGIGNYYREINGLSGRLGYPLSPEVKVEGGWFQEFSEGFITYISKVQRYAIIGSIYKEFINLGGFETTGFALSNEEFNNPSGLWLQDFENGTIALRANGGRGLVSPIFLQAWRDSLDGTKIGAPISKAENLEALILQDFESATLVYGDNKKVIPIKGSIKKYVDSIGGIATTGLPLEIEYKNSEGFWLQEYENGTVIWKNSIGSIAPSQALKTAIMSYGHTFTGSQISYQNINGSTLHMKFANIDLIQIDDSTVIPIKGSIKKYVDSIGGIATTGLPLEIEYKNSEGFWLQEYENGTVIWKNSIGSFSKR